jgi:hypothetical protein
MIRVLSAAALACAMTIAIATDGQAGGRPPAGTAGQSYANLTNEQVRTTILDACVVGQWQKATSNRDEYANRCGCYARRVTAQMAPQEFDAFRATGYFADVTRPKAEAALAACRVTR